MVLYATCGCARLITCRAAVGSLEQEHEQSPCKTRACKAAWAAGLDVSLCGAYHQHWVHAAHCIQPLRQLVLQRRPLRPQIPVLQSLVPAPGHQHVELRHPGQVAHRRIMRRNLHSALCSCPGGTLAARNGVGRRGGWKARRLRGLVSRQIPTLCLLIATSREHGTAVVIPGGAQDRAFVRSRRLRHSSACGLNLVAADL